MTSWLKGLFTKKAVIQKQPAPSEKVLMAPPINNHPYPLPAPHVRVVFMGTPELSATLLGALIEEKYHIVGVVTKPDRPVGRKNEIVGSPVKDMATLHSLPLLQPEKLDAVAIQQIGNWKPEMIVVAAYGKILPAPLLALPKFGCINFHPSLLPKWRGASPIQNALLAGETQTGITIMLMDQGMDTGDILAQETFTIAPDDTIETLTAKGVSIGQKLLLKTLPQWVGHHITPVKQDNTGATLCQLIEREDGRILWTDDALNIHNRYRALSPWPGIFTYFRKDGDLLRLKLLSISFQKNNPQITQPLGQVFEIGEKIGVQTTSGIIFLEQVQLESKTPLPIREFLRGNETLLGSLLE